MKFFLKKFQVDNQLPLTAFPVLFCSPLTPKDYVLKLSLQQDRSLQSWMLCFPTLRIWVGSSRPSAHCFAPLAEPKNPFLGCPPNSLCFLCFICISSTG